MSVRTEGAVSPGEGLTRVPRRSCSAFSARGVARRDAEFQTWMRPFRRCRGGGELLRCRRLGQGGGEKSRKMSTKWDARPKCRERVREGELVCGRVGGDPPLPGQLEPHWLGAGSSKGSDVRHSRGTGLCSRLLLVGRRGASFCDVTGALGLPSHDPGTATPMAGAVMAGA